MKTLLIGLTAFSLTTPAVAALPAQVDGDLRCIAVLSAAIGKAPEGEQRMQIIAGTMYFVGRVEGTTPTLDLRAELTRLMPSLAAANIPDETKRCAAILAQMGAKLQEVGNALKEQGSGQGAK